jgi:hypothetical protein
MIGRGTRGLLQSRSDGARAACADDRDLSSYREFRPLEAGRKQVPTGSLSHGQVAVTAAPGDFVEASLNEL